MAYVGHRYVLPQQNSNEWEHYVDGTVGEYSSWSLMSSTHLLEDVGDPTLPDHSEYSTNRQLWQIYSGEQAYAPMELAKFSHGGQDAPYLRHINWENHSVPGAKMFPDSVLVSEATAAEAELGAISSASNDFRATGDGGTGNLTFDLTVDSGTVQNVVLDGNYTTRNQLITALNANTDGVEFSNSSDVLFVVSNTVGSGSSVVIDNVTNPQGSGVTTADASGADASYESAWGHDGTRVISTSRHSNFFFYGVPAADATFDGRPMRYWDDEDLPSYATRHAPYEYKGVGDDHVEDPGEDLSVKYARAEESNEYGHQKTQQWFGVESAKAL